MDRPTIACGSSHHLSRFAGRPSRPWIVTGISPYEATNRRRLFSRRGSLALFASHRRAAFSARRPAPTEPRSQFEMMRRISVVAVCCFIASIRCSRAWAIPYVHALSCCSRSARVLRAPPTCAFAPSARCAIRNVIPAALVGSETVLQSIPKRGACASSREVGCDPAAPPGGSPLNPHRERAGHVHEISDYFREPRNVRMIPIHRHIPPRCAFRHQPCSLFAISAILRP